MLPEPPDVNITAGDNYTICFLSQHVEGILLDSYEVTIMDITGGTLYQMNHTIVENDLICSQIGSELFKHHATVCAPFIITVKAVNDYGSRRTDKTIDVQPQGSNECLCLEDTGMHYS